jgi:hypothetical protein
MMDGMGMIMLIYLSMVVQRLNTRETNVRNATAQKSEKRNKNENCRQKCACGSRTRQPIFGQTRGTGYARVSIRPNTRRQPAARKKGAGKGNKREGLEARLL